MNAAEENKKFRTYIQDKLGRARSFEYYKRQIEIIVQSLGFSHFDFALISKRSRIFDCSVNFLPKELLDSYHGRKLYKYDLFLDSLFHQNQPIFQSDIYDILNKNFFPSELIEKNKIIEELLNDFIFFDAYCIPIEANSSDKQIMLSVLIEGSNKKQFQEHIESQKIRLKYLADILYQTSAKKFSRHFPYKPLLTGRQTQVLEAMANHDFSTTQAADFLQISVSGINKHVESAKQTLGTSSMSRTIILAREKGLIHVD